MENFTFTLIKDSSDKNKIIMRSIIFNGIPLETIRLNRLVFN